MAGQLRHEGSQPTWTRLGSDSAWGYPRALGTVFHLIRTGHPVPDCLTNVLAMVISCRGGPRREGEFERMLLSGHGANRVEARGQLTLGVSRGDGGETGGLALEGLSNVLALRSRAEATLQVRQQGAC